MSSRRTLSSRSRYLSLLGRARSRTPPYRGNSNPMPFSSSPLPPAGEDVREGGSGTSTGSQMSSRSTTPASVDPVSLETLFELCKNTSTEVKSMNVKLCGVITKTEKLADSMKELNERVKKYCKESFTIKGSQYEGLIKTATSRLFLLSIKRKPDDSDVKEVVVRVLGTQVRDKYKFDAAYSFAKNKLTEYRTEERRKVVGIAPYATSCYLETDKLGEQIINSMCTKEGVDESVMTTYLNHLTILRKFVRECAFFPATNFYGSFREWLDLNYQHFNDETWKEIMDEDANIDYKSTGSGVDSTLTEQVVESEDS